MATVELKESVQEVLDDPVKFYYACWPNSVLYQQQKEILWSLRDNDETFVPAGNGLGKDYISAVAAIWFFCSRRPARVVTTSVKYDQLNDVLWGEIRRLLNSCEMELPITYNHMHIRQTYDDGEIVPLCELRGQCVNKQEGLLGRHLPRDIPRTLVIFDEASGIDTTVYTSTDTWAHKKLIIGNPFPCENFFKKGVQGGDLLAPSGDHYYRKVIRIKAEQSPNVRLAQAQIDKGEKPTHEILVPGLVDWATYQKRRATWDKVMQCIGLDAEFYEGAETLLFPPEWLNAAEDRANTIKKENRRARTIGIDPAEGGDKTVWSVCDDYGVMDIISKSTPDTATITGETLAVMRQYNVKSEDVLFDAGGGGKQHADRLRAQGYNVRAIAFGAAATPERRRGMATIKTRNLDDETRYAYRNRRAEMYGILSLRLDPNNERPFAIPQKFTELRRQLSPIPRRYDGEGRLILPPKRKKSLGSTEETLIDLIGCSPDEADATVLAVFGLVERKRLARVTFS